MIGLQVLYKLKLWDEKGPQQQNRRNTIVLAMVFLLSQEEICWSLLKAGQETGSKYLKNVSCKGSIYRVIFIRVCWWMFNEPRFKIRDNCSAY